MAFHWWLQAWSATWIDGYSPFPKYKDVKKLKTPLIAKAHQILQISFFTEIGSSTASTNYSRQNTGTFRWYLSEFILQKITMQQASLNLSVEPSTNHRHHLVDRAYRLLTTEQISSIQEVTTKSRSGCKTSKQTEWDSSDHWNSSWPPSPELSACFLSVQLPESCCKPVPTGFVRVTADHPADTEQQLLNYWHHSHMQQHQADQHNSIAVCNKNPISCSDFHNKNSFYHLDRPQTRILLGKITRAASPASWIVLSVPVNWTT